MRYLTFKSIFIIPHFQASNVDCSDINPDAYIAALYETEEQWNAAVEQRKTTMMSKWS